MSVLRAALTLSSCGVPSEGRGRSPASVGLVRGGGPVVPFCLLGADVGPRVGVSQAAAFCPPAHASRELSGEGPLPGHVQVCTCSQRQLCLIKTSSLYYCGDPGSREQKRDPEVQTSLAEVQRHLHCEQAGRGGKGAPRPRAALCSAGVSPFQRCPRGGELQAGSAAREQPHGHPQCSSRSPPQKLVTDPTQQLLTGGDL